MEPNIEGVDPMTHRTCRQTEQGILLVVASSRARTRRAIRPTRRTQLSLQLECKSVAMSRWRAGQVGNHVEGRATARHDRRSESAPWGFRLDRGQACLAWSPDLTSSSIDEVRSKGAGRQTRMGNAVLSALAAASAPTPRDVIERTQLDERHVVMDGRRGDRTTTYRLNVERPTEGDY